MVRERTRGDFVIIRFNEYIQGSDDTIKPAGFEEKTNATSEKEFYIQGYFPEPDESSGANSIRDDVAYLQVFLVMVLMIIDMY